MVYLSPAFRGAFLSSDLRKNMVYLSRNFRLPFAEPFCRSLSRKKKILSRSFREPLLKHFNGHPLLNPLQGAFDRSSHLSCPTGIP